MLLEIAGLSIKITKKRIKNVNLRICPPDGIVKVSVPMHYKEPVIREFITQKYAWIEQQRARIQSHCKEQNPLMRTGIVISFKGEDYSLVLKEHYGPKHVECKDGFIYCFIHHNPTQAEIINLLDCWYKQQMQILLPDLIKHWQSIVGVEVAAWGIKKMKTRWGSCNTRTQRIWLNLNLIRKPMSCLEYVLVHELVHLHEASHNQRFYQLMDHFMPQWRQYDFLLEGKKTRK